MIVTGTFRDATGKPRAAGTIVKFYPDSNPAADGTGVLTAIMVSVLLDEAGSLNQGDEADGIALEQGVYLVQIGNNPRDKFHITVPDSDATADITTLMEPSDFLAPEVTQQGQNFRIKNGYLQRKNRDTGLWHTTWLVGPAGMEQDEIVTPGDA
jgi:hypothetical protein